MTFTTRVPGQADTTKPIEVQQWYKVPNDAAYELTLKEEMGQELKIDGHAVPVIVLGYFKEATKQTYPVSPKSPRAEQIAAEELNARKFVYYEWPVLRVAPFEPEMGWDVGTTVWAHLLQALGGDRDAILTIAHANPGLSQMLYEKLDHIGNSLGFGLHRQGAPSKQDWVKVLRDGSSTQNRMDGRGQENVH